MGETTETSQQSADDEEGATNELPESNNNITWTEIIRQDDKEGMWTSHSVHSWLLYFIILPLLFVLELVLKMTSSLDRKKTNRGPVTAWILM